ncbi:MAG: hypothetical protein FWE34_04085 [Defluviitaleaceae bacterium]|nr:hypothetical protein [Defluviitaleaceae bacterium]
MKMLKEFIFNKIGANAKRGQELMDVVNESMRYCPTSCVGQEHRAVISSKWATVALFHY